MKKQTKKHQNQSNETTFGLIVGDEVFPFSMTVEQLDRYQKSLKNKKNKI